MTDDRRIYEALLRRDFVTFLMKVFATTNPGQDYRHNWHIDAIAYLIGEALAGRKPRLIINLPPRYLKSVIVSVALPAWVLGHDPSRRIICASYGDELSRKHARDFRLVVESQWYRDLFPAMRIDPRKNTEAEIATTANGFRYATSVGGALTGRGANIIIVDDPLKAAEAESDAERVRVNEWFDSTLYTRLDDKAQGIVIVAMHRLHQDDVTGHLTERGGFAVLTLPAVADGDGEIAIGKSFSVRRRPGDVLHPERENRATLDEIRRRIGSRNFSAQYQQAPVPADGNMIMQSWFRSYPEMPLRESFSLILTSWDVATKTNSGADYSVGTVWGAFEGRYFLLDLVRGRWEFPDLVRQVERQAEWWRPTVIAIEDANTGSALIQHLQTKPTFSVVGVKSRLSKDVRAAQQLPLFESGRVLFPVQAPWLDDLQAELCAFPNGRHDDQLDSVIQALQQLEERAGDWNGAWEFPTDLWRPSPWGEMPGRPSELGWD